jgi:hypothetical protein
MSFILVPERGEDLQVNAWSWRPTLELLRAEGLINEESYERMGAQGAGGLVDAEITSRIAQAIESRLAGMRRGERVLADLNVTDGPKAAWVITPDAKPDDLDVNDIYSASYEWLMEFAGFCKKSGGFKVY